MGTSSRYARDRTVASTAMTPAASGTHPTGSDDADRGAAARAFFTRNCLVISSYFDEAASGVGMFPATSHMTRVGRARMLASYTTTPAVFDAPSPAASADRAATEAARASALAHTATVAAARATEAANRAAASLDQLIEVQVANTSPSNNGDASGGQ